MDKWKDMELEKMKVGGNRKAQEFFSSQPDYQKSMSLLDKYNSKAAALYRDKVGFAENRKVVRFWFLNSVQPVFRSILKLPDRLSMRIQDNK